MLLSPKDKEALIHQGLLSSVDSNGTRRLHRRRLNRFSDEENSHLPLGFVSIAPPEIFSIIPEDLVSLATIKYLGYDDASAARIWSDWVASAPGDPVPEIDPVFEMHFLEPIIGYSYGRRDLNTYDDNDEKWYECMTRRGINQDTQAAIMDPAFRRIRLTESCLFWIRNTIEMRYRALEEIQEASQERERILRGDSKHPRRPIPQQQAAINAIGSITLYKGTDRAQLEKLFDDDGNVEDANYIARLLSPGCTDFCRLSAAGYYFSVHREIAEHYACYTKRRSDASSVVIVHVTIKTSDIESFLGSRMQQVYWPSEEWKRLVYHSRRGLRYPPDLQKFNQASLIIGTTTQIPGMVYINHKLNGPGDITDKMVFKTRDGSDAIQYAFHNEEGEDFLIEKADLKIFPVTTAEYEKWYEEVEE